ncbi:cob(I)yrinic acid a,c-diamide adenosyltransferase [Afifella pfennigii]|uniref:cob(I)yrinic acid a,c-diamide adenosyltransferase n=1 Tax=Afifella pfennigii TaxID=209897 RepID=UPI000691C615|nr:cob(I)yrinic acid a,c-diamide adenosyltransferase [Afifella pfennigii]
MNENREEKTERSRLTRVVTRGGDKGETSLGRGVRVSKSDKRVEAYGTIDEASAQIGLVRSIAGEDVELCEMLRNVQIDLFNLAADLHMPGEHGEHLRVGDEPLQRLEAELEAMNAALPRITNFVLAGGTVAAAHAHVARTTIRRAERRVVALSLEEEVNPNVLVYINRLADFMFIASRRLNGNGATDDVWAPRAKRPA